MCDSFPGSTAAAQGTKRTHSGSHRHPSTSNASSTTTGLSENPISSLALRSPVTPEILNHIDAIKHLEDWRIAELLQSARHYGNHGITGLWICARKQKPFAKRGVRFKIFYRLLEHSGQPVEPVVVHDSTRNLDRGTHST
ncbi:hypothetical protein K490DRAFT_61504 [Saccharata proteae CBS 121410]|uniref:Uncharacterized protein n=1 Tax=Saccharata proteae CBS 121410 TaxID=1314787 RepID=A0A9P4HZB7_9PEZI|nr:hypothetical protein K490DRAFT_61504 [Saccharata proteae CBS 121410]